MSSKAARFQLTWASSEKPGGKTGDEAILEWLQTPRNAARYIRLWNNIAEADSKATFSAELTTFVNNNSSPQRTPSSVQKRVQRFDELLKESKALLSSGASERAILKHFPYYHECMKCMENGLEVLRQELDAKGEKDGYYDKIFEAYQSHITQRTRSERRSKSTSLPDTPSPILPSRDTLFDMPPSPSSPPSMTKQSSFDSASSSSSSSSSHVDKKNTFIVPPSLSSSSSSSSSSMRKQPSIDSASSSSSSSISNQTSSSLERKASQHPPTESPPRPNKRGFCIESDSTSSSDGRLHVDPTPSSSSSLSLSHQSPSLSRPISTTHRPLHIRPDTPSSSKSIPSQPREKSKKERVSHQQSRNHHPQQHSDMSDTEAISQELTQLLQETNKNVRRIMKINQRIEKRKLLVEKRKLALSKSREMDRKTDLINTMLESGFSKDEISQTINK